MTHQNPVANEKSCILEQEKLSSNEHQHREVHISMDVASNEALNHMGIELAQFLDSSPIPTLVIDIDHRVTHWNRASEYLLGYSAASMVGSKNQWKPFYELPRPLLADLVLDQQDVEKMRTFYSVDCSHSSMIKGAYYATAFFPNLGQSGLWLHFTAAPLFKQDGTLIGAIEFFEDITEQREVEKELKATHVYLESIVVKRTNELQEANAKLEADILKRRDMEQELIKRNAELTELNQELSNAQAQLMQSEKMASIGQLAAGVAHEINNPVGYIFSNVGSLEKYLDDLFEMLDFYNSIEDQISSPETKKKLEELKARIEIDFLKEDIPDLMTQSKEGIDRVRKIVQDLKDFSRVDANLEWQWTNLHPGIDSTLNVVSNEIRYHADIVKDYGDIPDIECLPSQLNQVFMNLVVNASHSMTEERGTITIQTRHEGDFVVIRVQDTGSGIPPDALPRIFDPFFTTKPIGKGTGLGLSLSYGIINKHNGSISVSSALGVGTTFTICLPIQHEYDAANEAEVTHG